MNEFRTWIPQHLDEAASVSHASAEQKSSRQKMLTASQLEELQKQAYEEAYHAGFEAGRKAGLDEIREKIARADQLLQGFDRSYQDMDDTVVQEIVALTIAMVKQLLRREIRMDPGQIVAIVREALNTLPVSSRGIRVQLNPEDATLLKENLVAVEDERTWGIIEDPMMSRGGCQVLTEQSLIDATVESQIAKLVAAVFGDEREND